MVVEASFLDPVFSCQRRSREGGKSDVPLTSFTWPATGSRSDSSRACIVEVCGVESSRVVEDAVGMLDVGGRICRVTVEFQTNRADV